VSGFFANGLKGPVEIGDPRDVGRDAERVAAEFPGRAADGLGVASDDDDPRAVVFEFFCGGEADAAIAAGDNGNFILEFYLSVFFRG